MIVRFYDTTFFFFLFFRLILFGSWNPWKIQLDCLELCKLKFDILGCVKREVKSNAGKVDPIIDH